MKKQCSHTYTIHKKGEKQKVESNREIGLLNSCYNVRRIILNEKLKAKAEVSFEMPEWIPRSCIDPLFDMKLLREKE